MGLEEQILHYFLKVFSFLFLFLFYFFYIFFIKKINYKNYYIFIKKNQNSTQIVEQNFEENFYNLFLYKTALKIIILNNNKVHFGKFKNIKYSNFIKVLNNGKEDQTVEAIFLMDARERCFLKSRNHGIVMLADAPRYEILKHLEESGAELVINGHPFPLLQISSEEKPQN